MRRIMSQLRSAQAVNLSRKTRSLYTHNKHWKNKVSKIFITSLGSNRGQRLQLKQNIEFSSLCILTKRSDDLYDNHIFAFKPLHDISRFLFKPLFYMLFFFLFLFYKIKTLRSRHYLLRVRVTVMQSFISLNLFTSLLFKY